jgi:virulence-associated protein VapD
VIENSIRDSYFSVCEKILELFSDIKRSHRRDELYEDIRILLDSILHESDQNSLLIHNLKSENETLKRKLQGALNGLDSFDSALRSMDSVNTGLSKRRSRQ